VRPTISVASAAIAWCRRAVEARTGEAECASSCQSLLTFFSLSIERLTLVAKPIGQAREYPALPHAHDEHVVAVAHARGGTVGLALELELGEPELLLLLHRLVHVGLGAVPGDALLALLMLIHRLELFDEVILFDRRHIERLEPAGEEVGEQQGPRPLDPAVRVAGRHLRPRRVEELRHVAAVVAVTQAGELLAVLSNGLVVLLRDDLLRPREQLPGVQIAVILRDALHRQSLSGTMYPTGCLKSRLLRQSGGHTPSRSSSRLARSVLQPLVHSAAGAVRASSSASERSSPMAGSSATGSLWVSLGCSSDWAAAEATDWARREAIAEARLGAGPFEPRVREEAPGRVVAVTELRAVIALLSQSAETLRRSTRTDTLPFSPGSSTLAASAGTSRPMALSSSSPPQAQPDRSACVHTSDLLGLATYSLAPLGPTSCMYCLFSMAWTVAGAETMAVAMAVVFMVFSSQGGCWAQL